MDTLRNDMLQALKAEHNTSNPITRKSTDHPASEKNKDQPHSANQVDHDVKHGSAVNMAFAESAGHHHHQHHLSNNVTETTATLSLPSEVLLTILDNLTISQLLVCQLVSHHFRTISRVVLMDKLGGHFLAKQQQQRSWHQYQSDCSLCQQQQQQLHMGPTPGFGLWLNTDANGLPPLPHYHYQSSNSATSQHHHLHSSHIQHQPYQIHQQQEQQQQQQHHHHHHLYQQQSMEGLAQHPQTDLHIHHQSQSYNIQTPVHPSSSPLQQSSSSSTYRRDAGYVAPGNIALFLFPYHDHTPTGWQERQSVHFQCTGIDRTNEQLVFAPIHSENGDCLKFNTNSWNLPSTTSPMGYFGSGLSRPSGCGIGSGGSNVSSGSSSPAEPPMATHKSPATGLDLFDYATGQAQSHNINNRSVNAMSALSSYSFTDQFKTLRSNNSSSGLNSPRSPSLSTSPSSSLAFTLSSLSSSINSSALSVSSFSSSAAAPSTISGDQPAASSSPWSTTSGGSGGEHYSVIGIKHGDWPEDRQSTSRWWGGGLHSSMTLQSMVFLPWSASPGGQGSVADFHQRLIRKREQQLQDKREIRLQQPPQQKRQKQKQRHGKEKGRGSNGHPVHHHHIHIPAATSAEDEIRSGAKLRGQHEGEQEDKACEKSCSIIHRHHLHLSRSRAQNPPAHHHRYFCLHHDRLMTDMAAFNSLEAAAVDIKSSSDLKRKIPMATAGSKHLSIDYGAKVTESKKCQFCLSSPCKANLEIQVKFDEVRVSLDWILSGFVPDHDKSPVLSSAARGAGNMSAV